MDLFFKNDGILNCCVPRHRLETRGGEISKGILRKNNLYEFIIKKFKKIKGARGPVTLQIFSNKSDNQYYGIELNARFGGGYPMSYNSGANYPEMIIREYLLNEKINFINDWDSNKVYVRYDNTINLETE